MPDVVLVGGGVIGLTIAEELATHGRSVLILDQGTPGRESSWAGAGMLPPGQLRTARSPEAKLRALSAEHWEATSLRLKAETGIDNGFLRCGSLCIGRENDQARLTRESLGWQREEIEVEEISGPQIREYESSLSPSFTHGYRLPQAAQVRNPRHLSALLASVGRHQVEIRSGTPCLGFDQRGDQILGVRTPSETISAGQVVITSGAWSSSLLEQAGCNLQIRPIRGQVVLLNVFPRLLNHLIEVGLWYLVPRADQRILVGATQEEAGFVKENTADGVEQLLTFARELVPALRHAAIERTWAGLRPGSPNGLPYLGVLPGYRNLYIAAGHFRSGLQMSLGTGRLMRQLLLGQPTEIDLSPYSADPKVRNSDPPICPF